MELSPERLEELSHLAHRLGVPNMNLALLHEALCHTSYANEQTDYASYGNERLEFLGDSVVGLTITEVLYFRFPQLREGDLSKIKSVLVSKRILSRRAQALGLNKYVLLGKGEEQTGGRDRPSILGNLFESVVGAIYISQGMGAAKEFILNQLGDELERAAAGESLVDYKSALQERVQRQFGVLPTYRLVRASGPDHDKEFAVEVCVGETVISEGVGKSKKQAEKAAAAKALAWLDHPPDDAKRKLKKLMKKAASLPGRRTPKSFPREGRVLAVDVGEKRIGIAISDQTRLIAQPFTTIEDTNTTRLIQQIGQLIQTHSVTAVVVGLPLSLDGHERKAASLSRKIGNRIRKSLNVPVVFWDERLSTVASERHLIGTGVRRKGRREIVDQYAAAWILEGFLEHLRQSANL